MKANPLIHMVSFCKPLFIITVLPLILPSCSHVYYSPNTYFVPMLEEQNEVKLSAFAYQGENTIGGEFQGAYGIGNNIGLVLGAHKFRSISEGMGYDNFSRGHFFEGGLGYFRPVLENCRFETYVGYGKGKRTHSYAHDTIINLIISYIPARVDDGDAIMTYKRSFIQASLGSNTRSFDVAYTVRYSYLSFSEINNTLSRTSDEYDKIRELNKVRDYRIFDQAITMIYGRENVKLQFQMATYFPITHIPTTFSGFSISAGICVIIPPSIWKKTGRKRTD